MTFGRIATWQVYDDTGRRKYLSADERRRFLEAADQLDPPLRALCRTLAFTGCRISEALALHRHHLDTDRKVVTIRTLKRRQTVFRCVPIPDELIAELLSLATTADGRLWQLHRATAWRAVKRTMSASNVAGPMACCRGLRHGFGMRAAGHNVPSGLIQRWMGHSSPTTTAIYIDAVGPEEREFASRMWREA